MTSTPGVAVPVRPPPARWILGWAVRGGILWVSVHFVAGFAGIGVFRALHWPFVAAVIALAARRDDRNRGDVVLLGNLGVPSWVPWTVSLMAAGVLEAVLVGVALAIGAS